MKKKNVSVLFSAGLGQIYLTGNLHQQLHWCSQGASSHAKVKLAAKGGKRGKKEYFKPVSPLTTITEYLVL